MENISLNSKKNTKISSNQLSINNTNLKSKESSIWHSLSIEETISQLNSTANGLSEEEAKARLTKYGLNEITSEKKESPLILLLNQFKSVLIIILIIAAIASISIGETIEAIAIIVIVLLAGILGFIQEYQAEKAIDSLKKMAAPLATAIRNGEEKSLPSKDIVPGDIITLKSGDKIPADARLLEAINLKIDEAPLTGESTSVEKEAEINLDKETPLAERKNMLYMGTSVLYGRAKAVVVSTGMNTEFGKIATLLQTTESRKTPLQISIDDLGRKLGILSIIIAIVLSVVGILNGYPLIEMFIWGVAIAVAVIPEALPAVVTISLALGVRRMVQRKALIRKLPAVETLGSVNIICSDKTGTLTQDEMTIRKIYVDDKLIDVSGVGYEQLGNFSIDSKNINPKDINDLELLLTLGSLCNDAQLKFIDGVWDVLGDPTEGAIIVAAEKAKLNVNEIKNKFKRIFEFPFSSDRKKMTTVHQSENKIYAISKGAPEIILDSCNYYLHNGKILSLTENEKQKILNIVLQLGEQALRVLAISYKELLIDSFNEEIEKDMIFAGLVAMIDPPREEVKDAIKVCESSGIKPIMITGDQKTTAVAIAKELGILKSGIALSGQELEKLSDEEFEKIIDNTEVFARISPEHKLKIVEALIKKGNIVAMTGDGVNDAPALKKADIGVAMGITGTEVSKEASDMILTDDNFASIVSAVEEGRSIFENIRKYLVFLLSGNIGTVFALIISFIANLPLPLSAAQILFINFIMDGIIAIALGVEPPEPGIMNRKPRKLQEGVLNKFSLTYISLVGFWISIVTTLAYVFSLNLGFSKEKAMTIFFATLIASRLFNGFNCRSLTQSIFKMGFFTNKALIGGILTTITLTLLLIYINLFAKAFQIVPLVIQDWIIVLIFSFTVLIVVEISKWIRESFVKR